VQYILLRNKSLGPGYCFFSKRHGGRNVIDGYFSPIAGITALNGIGSKSADFFEFVRHVNTSLIDNIKKRFEIMGKGKIHVRGEERGFQCLFNRLLGMKAYLFRQNILTAPQRCKF